MGIKAEVYGVDQLRDNLKRLLKLKYYQATLDLAFIICAGLIACTSSPKIVMAVVGVIILISLLIDLGNIVRNRRELKALLDIEHSIDIGSADYINMYNDYNAKIGDQFNFTVIIIEDMGDGEVNIKFTDREMEMSSNTAKELKSRQL